MAVSRGNVQQGIIYVVATPIGNPLDWTERAKNTLGEVDIIAAEDTRVLKAELKKLNITPQKVVSYHDHNEAQLTPKLIEELKSGKSVAVCSDAGTPLVSDPGFRLISRARKENVQIVPVPGASSLTAALSVAAMGGSTVFFGGFLPQQSRQRFLEINKNKADTLIFFEVPHRLRDSLADAEQVFGPTKKVILCRELTKPYEEIVDLELAALRKKYSTEDPRGEFVLVFEGEKIQTLGTAETESEVKRLLKLGLSATEVLESLQSISDVPRKELYSMIQSFKRKP